MTGLFRLVAYTQPDKAREIVRKLSAVMVQWARLLHAEYLLGEDSDEALFLLNTYTGKNMIQGQSFDARVAALIYLIEK